MPMAVQCVPDRVLDTVLQYSEDVYVAMMENSYIKLRESSRHKTNVLCLKWWRMNRPPTATFDKLSIKITPFPLERCQLRRVRVWDESALCRASVTFAGHYGLLSDSYIHAAFNMSTAREPGKTVWIWDQQHVAICSSSTKYPEVHNIPALLTFNHVAAVNRKYILGAREVRRMVNVAGIYHPARSFQAQVFELEPTHSSAAHTSAAHTSATQPIEITGTPQPHPGWVLFPRPIEISIMAASFVNASSPEFLVVGHDFAVTHQAAAKASSFLGNLIGRSESGSTRGVLRSHAWSCALLYEEEGIFLFCFCAKMPAGHFFFHLLRFAVILQPHPSLEIKTSWKSDPRLSCACFDLQAAAKIDCSIDALPSSSSLLMYQSREVLVGFDRKTLCGSRSAVRLPHGSSACTEIYAPFGVGYSRVVCKSLPCPALSVVVDGIRLSKEKRLRRKV